MKKVFSSMVLFSFLLSMAHQANAQVPTNGLLLWYPFSGNAKDGSSNLNHGIVTNATLTADRFGKPNKAYRFYGVTNGGPSTIVSKNKIAITGSQPRTVSFWFNRYSVQPVEIPGILGWGNSSRVGFSNWFHIKPDSSMVYRGHYQDFQSPSNSIHNNKWYHVVYTYNGYKGIFYINGVKSTSAIFNSQTFSTELQIGHTTEVYNFPGGDWPAYFDGAIDDIRIYNRELDYSEVKLLYKEGVCNNLTLSITINKTDASCFGTLGNISATVSGGEAPYVYKISGQATQLYSPTHSFDVKPANYRIYFIDANGCNGQSNIITVVQPLRILPTIKNKKNVTCFAGTDGFVVVKATNGAAPFQYKMESSGTYSSTDSFPTLKAGHYKVYIKDANGCVDSLSTFITQPLKVQATVTKTDETCPLAKDGSMTVTGTVGVSPFLYKKYTSGTYSANNTFSNLAAATYRVLVKDVNSCSTTVAVPILLLSTTCLMANKIEEKRTAETMLAIQQNELAIYPNPASTIATLRIKDNRKAIAITIMDVSGKILWQAQNLNSKKIILPIEKLSRGMYMVAVNDGDTRKVVKLVKE